MHESEIPCIFYDIKNGYSESKINEETVFVKHLDLECELKYSKLYDSLVRKYKESGLPTREERLLFLKEEGDWSEQDDLKLKKESDFLKSLIKTKEKLVIPSQKESIEKTIKETFDKINSLTIKKEILIGATCEKYANIKKEEALIVNSIFKDNSLKIKYITEDDFDYLDEKEALVILNCYNKVFEKINDDSIKKIAVWPIFYNFFSLCDKANVFLFFSKNPTSLTFFQEKLLHYGMNVRSIIDYYPDIPDDVKSSYDKLFEFHKSSDNDKSKNSTGKKSFFSPEQFAKSKGKNNLNKKDFINMFDS